MEPLHDNSKRPQHPTLTNVQVIETEAKERYNENKWYFESNVFYRYLQKIPSKHKARQLLFNISQNFLQDWPHTQLSYKASLNRHKTIEIIPCSLSDHHGFKLDFNNNRNNICRKPTYSCKLNNSLLNDHWVREKINNTIKDFL